MSKTNQAYTTDVFFFSPEKAFIVLRTVRSSTLFFGAGTENNYNSGISKPFLQSRCTLPAQQKPGVVYHVFCVYGDKRVSHQTDRDPHDCIHALVNRREKLKHEVKWLAKFEVNFEKEKKNRL